MAFAARVPFCSAGLFVFDAADYIRAIHEGFWAQYTGSDSMPVTAFLDTYRHDSRFREHPWGLIYRTNDGAALRHFHVPLAFYLPSLADSAGYGRRAQRLLVALISAATVMTVFLMLTFAGTSAWLAFFAGLLLSLSPVLVLAGTTLSPHALFSLTALVCVFSLCRWMETRHDGWLALFAIAFGSSIATLELTPLLVVVIVALLTVTGKRHLPFLKVSTALLASLGIAMALWPGGVIRGGYLMSYGVFVFQGLFRSSLYFRQRNLPLSIYQLGEGWITGALLVVLLVSGIYAAIRVRRSLLLSGLALFSALLFGQGLANGFRNPTYASHAVFAIVLTGALAAHFLCQERTRASRSTGRAILVLIGALTLSQAVALWRTSPAEATADSQRVAGAIACLRSHYAPGTQFVITEDPQAFITNAPEYRFAGSASVESTNPEPWIQLGSHYILFDRKAAKPPANVAFCSPGRLNQFGYLISCSAT